MTRSVPSRAPVTEESPSVEAQRNAGKNDLMASQGIAPNEPKCDLIGEQPVDNSSPVELDSALMDRSWPAGGDQC